MAQLLGSLWSISFSYRCCRSKVCGPVHSGSSKYWNPVQALRNPHSRQPHLPHWSSSVPQAVTVVSAIPCTGSFFYITFSVSLTV